MQLLDELYAQSIIWLDKAGFFEFQTRVAMKHAASFRQRS
tara:strand:+ start:35550 stop:35669 length:120 start_codon:yes stop_codon:yes gene_type:complete